MLNLWVSRLSGTFEKIHNPEIEDLSDFLMIFEATVEIHTRIRKN